MSTDPPPLPDLLKKGGNQLGLNWGFRWYIWNPVEVAQKCFGDPPEKNYNHIGGPHPYPPPGFDSYIYYIPIDSSRRQFLIYLTRDVQKLRFLHPPDLDVIYWTLNPKPSLFLVTNASLALCFTFPSETDDNSPYLIDAVSWSWQTHWLIIYSVAMSQERYPFFLILKVCYQDTNMWCYHNASTLLTYDLYMHPSSHTFWLIGLICKTCKPLRFP